MGSNISLEEIIKMINEYGSLQDVLDSFDNEGKIVFLNSIKDYISTRYSNENIFLVYDNDTRLLQAFFKEIFNDNDKSYEYNHYIDGLSVEYGENQILLSYLRKKENTRKVL